MGPRVQVMWHTQMTYPAFADWFAEMIKDKDAHDTPLWHLGMAVKRGKYTLDHVIEWAGRVCYQSWYKGRPHEEYIKNILEQRHGSVLEHASITFAIDRVSRSLTHELVRHRAGFAFSQESQRYAAPDGLVIPPTMPPHLVDVLREHHRESMFKYHAAVEAMKTDMPVKRAREVARSFLPNATATSIVVTANLRSLRHFFELRGSPFADPEIRQLAVAMLLRARPYAPIIFSDVLIELDGTIKVTHSKV